MNYLLFTLEKQDLSEKKKCLHIATTTADVKRKKRENLMYWVDWQIIAEIFWLLGVAFLPCIQTTVDVLYIEGKSLIAKTFNIHIVNVTKLTEFCPGIEIVYKKPSQQINRKFLSFYQLLRKFSRFMKNWSLHFCLQE